MHARRASLILGFVVCGLPVAAQETQVSLRIVPDTARPGARHSRELHFATAPAEKLPEFKRPQNLPALRAELPRATPPATPCYRFDLPAALAPLRVTAERGSFLTEARIPFAQLWSGRLRFSGVQQRFHAASLYSAVNPSHWAEIAQAPGVERIVGRARVNYGVGLQLRFGR